jgi:hypothetical protein
VYPARRQMEVTQFTVRRCVNERLRADRTDRASVDGVTAAVSFPGNPRSPRRCLDVRVARLAWKVGGRPSH